MWSWKSPDVRCVVSAWSIQPDLGVSNEFVGSRRKVGKPSKEFTRGPESSDSMRSQPPTPFRTGSSPVAQEQSDAKRTRVLSVSKHHEIARRSCHAPYLTAPTRSDGSISWYKERKTTTGQQNHCKLILTRTTTREISRLCSVLSSPSR